MTATLLTVFHYLSLSVYLSVPLPVCLSVSLCSTVGRAQHERSPDCSVDHQPILTGK